MINPAFADKIPAEVRQKVSLPKGYHEGLHYDGKNMWVSNGEGMNTWLIDLSDGTVVSEIIPVGKFTEAVTGAPGNTFWVTDWEEKNLYRVRIEEGRMEEISSVSLAPSRPTGIVWTGDKLFMITWTRGMGTRYDLHEMDGEGDLIRKTQIKGIHEPAQIAYDGEALWITSWYNRRVYKLDPESVEVLGSFRSPADRPTGIVWVGKDLWITGTYADLFRIRLKEE